MTETSLVRKRVTCGLLLLIASLTSVLGQTEVKMTSIEHCNSYNPAVDISSIQLACDGYVGKPCYAGMFNCISKMFRLVLTLVLPFLHK